MGQVNSYATVMATEWKDGLLLGVWENELWVKIMVGTAKHFFN